MKSGQIIGIALIGAVGALAGVFGSKAQGWATRNLHVHALSTTTSAAGGTSSGGGAAACGWTAVGVADGGGFPLEVKGSQIRQQQCTERRDGNKSYGTNDVFQVLGPDGLPTGQWVAFLGNCHFVDAGDHSVSVGVDGC